MTADSHLAHGLAGDETPPDWPPLRADELRALLARYPGTPVLQRIAWRSPRPLSAAAIADTSAGPLFVKRHHCSVRSVETLCEEHRFTRHLAARGVPVAALHADLEGQTAVAIGEWTYEIQSLAEGVDLYRDLVSWQPLPLESHAYAAGEMLARLHQAAEGYTAPQRSTHLLVARSEILAAADPVAEIRRQLPERPALAEWLTGRDWERPLERALLPWHAAAQPAIARLPPLWTHGDWHASNLAWSRRGADARVSSVLDFGLAAHTFALFDLATAIERNAIAWLELDARGDGDIARPEIALALIDGYCSRLPLDCTQIHLLADLLPIVHVDFALSEIEYYHAITRAPANADLAWDAFLLGHPAWFRSGHGQALLDAVRAAA